MSIERRLRKIEEKVNPKDEIRLLILISVYSSLEDEDILKNHIGKAKKYVDNNPALWNKVESNSDFKTLTVFVDKNGWKLA